MILQAQKLTKTFTQGQTHIEVLRQVELSLRPGETVAVVGQSGSGKSTLLSLLAGLDYPTQGEVSLAGKPISHMGESELARYRAAHLGIVFQQFHLMPSLTARENVQLPLDILGQEGGGAAAKENLDRVGLGHRLDHYPSQLSGGECQRVAIARAMVIRPALLLADEPSGNLDTETGEKVMDLLFDLVRDRQMTLLLVTHNFELAARCGRQLTLRDGKLVSDR